MASDFGSDTPKLPPKVSRRAAIKKVAGATATATAVLAAPVLVRNAAASGMSSMDMGGKVPRAANRPGLFDRPVVMPAEIVGKPYAANGSLHYYLRMANGRTSLVTNKMTPTWGYNRSYLGPTLRIPRGKPVTIDVENGLNQSTTTHWHGAQVRGVMDGGPQCVIGVHKTYHYAFTLNQPAATLWYHPHPTTRTGGHIFAGLAGLLIVDDRANEPSGLPRTYGVDDLPVIIQDRALHPDGTLSYMPHNADRMGMKGNIIMVNGREQPYADVPAQWVRLRLLNASNARLYYFGFSDNREFQAIASDGGLLRHAVPIKRLLLAPSERAEIMVDLAQDHGKAVVLRSYSKEIVPTLSTMTMDSDALDRSVFDILQLRVSSPSGSPTSLPAHLATIENLSTTLPVRRFTLQGLTNADMKKPVPGEHGRQRPGTAPGPGDMTLGIGGEKFFSINHQYMDMKVINFGVKLGSTEIWAFVNQSGMAHPLHYHGVSFQIIDVNGKPPEPQVAGWKDTVLVRHGETVRVIAKFKHPASARYPFMYHCHILEHEDNGMMGQFTVT